MTTNKILNKVDHTLLSQTATWEDIKTVLDDAVKYRNRVLPAYRRLCKTGGKVH